MRQNGDALTQRDGEWRPQSFEGSLSIDFEQGPPVAVSLFDGDPLIFKLKNDWRGNGRKVPRPTSGHFIVIAPVEWRRRGQTPVEPDGCSDPAYMAHYFFRDGSSPPGEIGGFEEHDIGSSANAFELIGTRVFDDSKEGDLFVGSAPQLRRVHRVVWARVGAEGQGIWRGRNFKPSEHSLAEVLGGRQGRFFIRVYGERGEMLDSGQFRYLRGLREIQIDGEQYSEHTLILPDASGHLPTKLRFVGADGLPVQATQPRPQAHVKPWKGGLIAEAHPDADEISCALRAGGGSVEIALHLPRIWWCLKQREAAPGRGWRSIPVQVTRHRFQKFAASGAELRLRLPARVKSALAAFGNDPGPRYPKKDGVVVLPLADFADYRQIDERLHEDAPFNVRFDPSGGQQSREPLTVIRVCSDPPPSVLSFASSPRAVAAGEEAILSWKTRNTEEIDVAIEPDVGPVKPNGRLGITPVETTAYTLRLTAPGLEDITRSVTVKVSHEQPKVVLPPFSSKERRNRTGSRAWFLHVHYRWETVGGSLQKALRDTLLHRLVGPGRIEYLSLLVDTFCDNRKKVEEAISSCLYNWRLDRLSVIDRGILRMGSTEILFVPDVQGRVAILESVRLAERYSGNESPRFVHGVLEAVLRFEESSASDTEPIIPPQEVRPRPDSRAAPVARVRRGGGGYRPGRGFSARELRGANLTPGDVSRSSIRTDGRRRSEHRANIEALRRLSNA